MAGSGGGAASAGTASTAASMRMDGMGRTMWTAGVWKAVAALIIIILKVTAMRREATHAVSGTREREREAGQG